MHQNHVFFHARVRLVSQYPYGFDQYVLLEVGIQNSTFFEKIVHTISVSPHLP